MRSGQLTVFFNASALPARPAGAGVYTLELGRALAADPSLSMVVAAPPPHEFGGEMVRTPAGRGRQAWEHICLKRAIARAEAALYHGPHFYTPRTPVPSVATVHDLTFFRLPARYDAAHRHFYRSLARTARRASRIIVPSAAVASDVVRFLRYPPERVRVIAEAPRSGLVPASDHEVSRLREEMGLHASYLLCLGTAEPGKRVVDAIRAMPAILAGSPGATLAIAGNPGALSRALEREAQRLGVTAAVRFLGYVPDARLPALLTGAEALVFPSLFEGFGLPPLEAMACGTPVIAASAPAMDDVLAGAARFVPRRDPAAIARESLAILASRGLRDELGERGREFVRRFSWARAAEETASVYREVAA